MTFSQHLEKISEQIQVISLEIGQKRTKLINMRAQAEHMADETRRDKLAYSHVATALNEAIGVLTTLEKTLVEAAGFALDARAPVNRVNNTIAMLDEDSRLRGR